jgi:hypothetical protein
LRTKPRWLIAIFALHFLVNVGLFAFGHIDTRSSAQTVSVGDARLVLVDAAHENDLLGHAPDHGLTDTQPELPEGLQPDVVWRTAASALLAPVSTFWTHLAPPALDGLRRPPRLPLGA